MKTQRRRRQESKTDYKARFAFLKSGKPRIIVRKTNKYILVQAVVSETAKDKVLASVSSRDLLKFGWPAEKAGSLKCLSAAYLTGIALGKKAKSMIKEAILDEGMHKNVHGSRIYAAAKGVSEAGLNINVNEEVFPSEERIMSNKNISKSLIEKVKENIK